MYDAGTPNEAWEWVNLREVRIEFHLHGWDLNNDFDFHSNNEFLTSAIGRYLRMIFAGNKKMLGFRVQVAEADWVTG